MPLRRTIEHMPSQAESARLITGRPAGAYTLRGMCVMETIGQAISRYRKDARLSQVALARAVSVSQSNVSRYEKDERVPDLAVLTKMDEVMGAEGELKALLLPSVTDGLTPDDTDRIIHSVHHPSRVDSATVDALAHILKGQRRLDDTLGPLVILPPVMTQIDTVTALLKSARGPHVDALAEVVGEWVQFAGWLHAETRSDKAAVKLLREADDLANDIGNGTLAAQAENFMGYIARQQGRPHAVVRHFLGAHYTPGAHPAQRIGDAAQAAQGYATLGERDEARRMLDVATGLLDTAGKEQAPGTAYWLTPTFHRLNIGIAHLALQDFADAADHLSAGLAGLPQEQHGAVWAEEYRAAYEEARLAS